MAMCEARQYRSLLQNLNKLANFSGQLADKPKYSDLADEALVALLLKYNMWTGKAGRSPNCVNIAKDGGLESTSFPDFDARHDVKYRTLYIPDTLSLDTFKTDFETIADLAPYEIEIPKSGWKKHVMPGDWDTALSGLESWDGIAYMWD